MAAIKNWRKLVRVGKLRCRTALKTALSKKLVRLESPQICGAYSIHIDGVGDASVRRL